MNNLILSAIFCLVFSFSACTSAHGLLTKNDPPQNSTGDNSVANVSVAKSDTSFNQPTAEAQTGGVTGTYEYNDGGRRNEIKVLQTGAAEIKVAFAGVYEFKSAAGYLNANTGSLDPQTIKIENNRAVLTPDEAPECHLSLTFKGIRLTVVQNENDCGFPGGVIANGDYRRTSAKEPVFDDLYPAAPEAALENQTGKTTDPAGKRVKFPAGADAATVTGKISDSTAVSYIIGARAGQTLDVEVIDGGENNDVVVTIADKKGAKLKADDSYGDRWSGRLPRTGDYVITVNTIETKNTDFKIRVTIR